MLTLPPLSRTCAFFAEDDPPDNDEVDSPTDGVAPPLGFFLGRVAVEGKRRGKGTAKVPRPFSFGRSIARVMRAGSPPVILASWVAIAFLNRADVMKVMQWSCPWEDGNNGRNATLRTGEESAT